MYEASLDDMPVYSYWRYPVRAGQVLRLNRAVQGMYGYLCVAGGLDVPEILGARATDLKAQFGGHLGRALQAGDQLALLESAGCLNKIGIAPIELTNQIRALPSSEYEQFSRKALYRLWQNPWILQSDSNRMGYRLGGGKLEREQNIDMLSHAVQFGTIQVPPSGQPIVLMADTQTTGGYPKIATVASGANSVWQQSLFPFDYTSRSQSAHSTQSKLFEPSARHRPTPLNRNQPNDN